MMGDQFTHTGGLGQLGRERFVLTWLAPERGIVFLQLHIGAAVVARRDLNSAFDDPGFEAIQGPVACAGVVVLIPWHRPGRMRELTESARDVHIDRRVPARESDRTDFVAGAAIHFDRHKTICWHELPPLTGRSSRLDGLRRHYLT